MAPPSLVGPPQVINTVTTAQPNSGARPPMGLTENLSPTFMISGKGENYWRQMKFKEKGYGDVVPQIVFWNLRHSESTPVTGTQKGVALLSGFSKNLLKLFLGKDAVTRPDQTMEEAISGKEYQNLVVVD